MHPMSSLRVLRGNTSVGRLLRTAAAQSRSSTKSIFASQSPLVLQGMRGMSNVSTESKRQASSVSLDVKFEQPEVPPPPKTSLWRRIWTNDWVKPEAEYLTYLAYRHHRALADTNPEPVPQLTKEQLESMGEPYDYPVKTLGDRFARTLVRALIPFNHMFFRDRYNHHACVLETVAAVPGMVAAMFRHFRSLRKMARDYGWINPLLEEAENERMHLLTWMQVTQPTPVEKMLVLLAQGIYAIAYASMYLFTPRTAHRFVGYLEQEAVTQYTNYLNAIDNGTLPNKPAPEIAKAYWRLPKDATIRDVVLYVRADETMHRNVNHHLAELYENKMALAEPALPPRTLEDVEAFKPKNESSK